jgi:transcriptional regulator with XRE-family HTH domain
MDLGKILKEIRLNKGLSAKELSQQSGVARSLISQLETGKRQSTGIDTICRLAKALGVSPAIFIEIGSAQMSGINYDRSGKPTNNINHTSYIVNEDIHSYFRLFQKAEKAGLSLILLEELIDIIVKFRKN